MAAMKDYEEDDDEMENEDEDVDQRKVGFVLPTMYMLVLYENLCSFFLNLSPPSMKNYIYYI